ncbi:MAG: hypothetical protein F4X60_07195 [Gemmatimonadetes bacterium]|nr:hypothetical protein [Gemmatimonadota bacterium]MYB98323.1 hypothetical protein [Gemmatimonadota bacterium]
MLLARELRASGASYSHPVAYQARAEGHIYFYLERDDGGEPVPMRVDQVAVDLYRSSDGRTRQILRGLRRQELLPVKDFRYYIDRLTAVQNGFGDRISIGQGRDVRDVPHPLSTEGGSLYHYRTVDSLRLTVHSLPAPITVYEVEVRPRRDDVPAFVGSVYLEGETGALVRMAFGFTPASYIDERTDRIHVRLEHALWEERFWLPYRQEVEVRREMPELDLPVGTIIRAQLEVTDYHFQPEFGPDFFSGPRVTMVPYGTADSTAFREGLLDRMAEEGLSPVSMARLEAEARQIAREQLVSGLPKMRLYADRFSSVLRANRGEGVHVGMGTSFAPRPDLKLQGLAGYGFASGKPSATLRGRWSGGGGTATTVELFGYQMRDLGPRSGASGALNTLSTVLLNRDYSDPYFATGARFAVRHQPGGGAVSLHLGAAWEHFDGIDESWSAGLGSDERQRPLRPVGEGAFVSGSGGFTMRWASVATWSVETGLTGTVGRWGGGGNTSIGARVEARMATQDITRQARVAVEAGASGGNLPQQLNFFLGGRGTLPGHPYRAYGGRRFLLARGEALLTLVPTWLTVRLLAGAGAVGATPGELADEWDAAPTGGLRGYVGAGLSTVHNILRIDGVWGLGDGSFELVLSVDQRLRPYL